MSAKILYWDIETAPITAHNWGLHDLHVGLNQVVQEPRMIAFGAKWHGKPVKFFSEYHDGRTEMLAAVHELLDEAEVVVSFNGDSFDTKWVMGELWREGFKPPSPYKSIDLYKIVRRHFRLMSNKLAHVSVVAGLEGKVDAGGHGLWMACLLGDEETQRKAWSKMRVYCKRDVALLEPLLTKLLPWLPANVNLAMLGGKTGLVCPSCESDHLQRRGFAVSASRRYPRYQCQDCGRWSKGSRMEPGESAQIQGEAR